MATATPAQAAPSARSRLAFFDSLELSQTPAGNNGRSPLCVDLSPHMEALNMSLKKQQATPRGSSTLASSTSAPTLLSPSQLFSPEKTAKLNAAAPEFKPPVSVPASPMAGGGKARPMLRVDAPEFVPPVQRSMSVTASPMRGHADAELRAQVQRMAHELEACRRRADIAEKALAASRSNAQARIEPLERELAQMRIVVAAARSSQQREQRNADDLRKRIAGLSDEVCELHTQKDTLHAQLASQHKLLRDQGAERERLESKLKQQAAQLQAAQLQAAQLQAAQLAAGATMPKAALPAAKLPASAGSDGNLAATVAALQQEMFALRHAVQPAPAPALAAAPPSNTSSLPAAMLPTPSVPSTGALPPLQQQSLLSSQPPAIERSASAPAELVTADGADGAAVRTSRSRRGGRGKGNKGKAAAAMAAAEAALSGVKENASCNANTMTSSTNGMAFMQGCHASAQVVNWQLAQQPQRNVMAQRSSA